MYLGMKKTSKIQNTKPRKTVGSKILNIDRFYVSFHNKSKDIPRQTVRQSRCLGKNVLLLDVNSLIHSIKNLFSGVL